MKDDYKNNQGASGREWEIAEIVI
jgi:hypothetical protein